MPLVFIPAGSSRSGAYVKPGFNAVLNYQHVTKHAEAVNTADMLIPVGVKPRWAQAAVGNVQDVGKKATASDSA